ncbi:FAD-binding oxidoreductase [bacterium]|nr:FAD-binding oxidoreductase [bacterium]
MKAILQITVSIVVLGCSHATNSTLLNDIHSQLNVTKVAAVIVPKSVEEIQAALREAKKNAQFVSISGGRHSMGGQQFGDGTVHLSMSSFNRVLNLDKEKGVVEVQSGIQWPELVDWLMKNQSESKKKWGIRQKQTGADRLSIGGALSSNIHGRGLKMRPMVDDVESFTLIDANGEIKTCSRTENHELFRLVIGGYGLFGVIGSVKVRLAPVTVLERVVKLINVQDFLPLVSKRVKDGFLYGDFQFAIDPKSDDFMKRGVYSLYRPTNKQVEVQGELKEMKGDDWYRLLGLAHTDKTRAFDIYSKFYLTTNGQFYRSDTHQMGVYVDDYHRKFDQGGVKATEMISEIYVPRNKLTSLFGQLREDFRKNDTNVVYGTVRLIEKDTESFLAWAKQNYAATVFNFHVDHSPEGIEKAKGQFQHIIDRALEHGGSYFLTYHRWARKDQVLKAYPQMVEFLRLKRKYDPEDRFQSDWYRYYREMFADRLSKP